MNEVLLQADDGKSTGLGIYGDAVVPFPPDLIAALPALRAYGLKSGLLYLRCIDIKANEEEKYIYESSESRLDVRGDVVVWQRDSRRRPIGQPGARNQG